ncbi:MAG TPA: PAS domain S-box protein [Methanofastidiosum sp.]|nr:PAS domain S-box protein [Methanofastidiosum sp.]HNU60834.1 PAS domain S-box protein [Methanofastidiosum sp.]
MEKPQLRILLVEDSIDDAELLVRLIKKGGYPVYYERIDTAKQMVEALTNKQWDVIISDYKMPGFSGIKALEILNEFDIDIPFILVSGTIGEQLAVEAMKKGANDYLMKDNLSRLVPAIEREIKDCKIRVNERMAQKEVIRLNRIYSVLSDINQMIVRAQNKQEIFEKACKIAVDKGQFVLAWIGLLTEDEYSLKPVAFAGLEDFESLFDKATFGDINWSKSFTFNTLKSGETKVFNDIQKYPELDRWRGYLDKTGLISMAIVPLVIKGKSIGAYFLHSNEINFFNEGEIKLLEELADDISFAIESIEREAKRKEIEKALIESENKFRSIFNNAAVGIDLMNNDYNFIELNDKLSEILGYKKSELIGKSILGVTYPDDVDITLKNLKALVNGDIDSYLMEKRYKKKDGSIFWGELFVSSIRKESGEFQAIVGVIVDINKRKKAEDLLKESEEKYRELVENANSIIAKFDKYGRILSMNEFGLKLFGYTEKELIGKTWEETILPKVESTGIILETLATDIVKDVDKYSINLNENVKKNGERVWIYWANKPIRDEHGKIKEILSVGTDVTDKMMAEKQMEKNVEYFAHLVDHIRNPLAILSGFIQVKVDNEETRARLMRQVDRIEDMIKQLDTGWIDTEETRKFLKKNR